MDLGKKVKTLCRLISNNYTWGCKGEGTKIIKPMRIINKKHIYLGDHVIILNDVRMEVMENGNAALRIGDGTSFEQGCHLIAADNLEIGRDCVFSAWVYISDCNHIYNQGKIMEAGLQVKKTRIGDNVFVGIGAKVMPGVTIGDNAVIGANAVVTKDVPPAQIWGGIPARYIKDNNID